MDTVLKYINHGFCIAGVICLWQFWNNRWQKYDPAWLVVLAEEQLPEEEWLHQALSKCTRIKGGAYFVNPKNPNQPGSEWQFDRNIELEHLEYGEIILDILKDGRIGGIEYLGLMLGKKLRRSPIQS